MRAPTTLQFVFMMTFLCPAWSAAEKAVFVSKCGEEKTEYFTVRDACRSGQHRGQQVVQCYRDEDGWSQRDIARCPRDGRKKGVYVGTCHGAYIGLNDKPASGCADEARQGQTLVYCRYGKVQERVFCYRNRALEDNRLEGIFIDDCHGEEIVNEDSLAKACRTRPNAVIMACEATCLKRTWFKCKQRQWLGSVARICGPTAKAESTAELSGCHHRQIMTVQAALRHISKHLPHLIKAVRSALSRSSDEQQITRLRRASFIYEKIRKKLSDGQNYRCLSVNEGRCDRGLASYAGFLEPIGLCPSFFEPSRTVEDNAAQLVKELAHKTGVNSLLKTEPAIADLQHPPKTFKDRSWEKLARTYAWWFLHGFCIPNHDCAGRAPSLVYEKQVLSHRDHLIEPPKAGTTSDDGTVEVVGRLGLTKGAQLTIGNRILKCDGDGQRRPHVVCQRIFERWKNTVVKIRGQGQTYRCGPMEQCLTGGQIAYLTRFTIHELDQGQIQSIDAGITSKSTSSFDGSMDGTTRDAGPIGGRKVAP